MRRLILSFALLCLAPVCSFGCTIFVLTDENRTLFFNNEDWSNPASRLWFVPAGADHLGCAYVGFDDGWAQGGLNTAGLAFDWVAGAMEQYTPDDRLARVRGNSAQRMLESCTTVDEAIVFYRAHRETEFARAQIMIADRSGSSVIIGAKNGALSFDRQDRSRGFGFGWKTLQQRLAAPPTATVENGAEILQACIQTGPTPTQYSNVFDLRTGEIFICPRGTGDKRVRFDLRDELAQGEGSYEIGELSAQDRPLRHPLSHAQKRFYLDKFSPLMPDEPVIASRIAAALRAAAQGRLREDEFTAEFWSHLAPALRGMQDQINQLGSLQHVTLVGRSVTTGRSVYQAVIDFAGARVLQRFEFSPEGKFSGIATEFVEQTRP